MSEKTESEQRATAGLTFGMFADGDSVAMSAHLIPSHHARATHTIGWTKMPLSFTPDEIKGIQAAQLTELRQNLAQKKIMDQIAQIAVEQRLLRMPHADDVRLMRRIAELEAENARLRASAADPINTDHVGPNDFTHRSVKDVVDHLLNGRVVPAARAGLRKALDKADEPPTGKMPDGSHRAPGSKAFRLVRQSGWEGVR